MYVFPLWIIIVLILHFILFPNPYITMVYINEKNKYIV